ncbi:FG-GAP repeat domain-containing protein [Octadecabacter sp. R77987]|uniref:FG-GAP repeat domain-containing protein n=1 Tax=Octadecabacter sp. R77987 TaxID=3093874 RepID=UPI00366FCFC1
MAGAQGITAAQYSDPTTRYDHGILGDAVEWGVLEMRTDQRVLALRLPQTSVFEDTAPRLFDVDGDGDKEVITVELSLTLGARLAIFDTDGLVAATPYIGRTHRWLAPIGAADLDRDGYVEIAYIDRPHLARTLRVWRFADGKLTLVAETAGLTNHRIGETDIGGGLRDCNGVIEMITANADWTRVIATRLENGALVSRDMGPHRGRADLTAAMAC